MTVLYKQGKWGKIVGNTQYSKATKETAENLRIIDDAMFRLVAERKEACQEILRTLLDRPQLHIRQKERTFQIFRRWSFCISRNMMHCITDRWSRTWSGAWIPKKAMYQLMMGKKFFLQIPFTQFSHFSIWRIRIFCYNISLYIRR